MHTFNRAYVSQLVSHLYGGKVYGFTGGCSWHCGGHCATIVGRVQRWWVTDNRKSSDGNGRKETRRGGRKVREIGNVLWPRIGTKIVNRDVNARAWKCPLQWTSLTTMKWKQSDLTFSTFFPCSINRTYHFYSCFTLDIWIRFTESPKWLVYCKTVIVIYMML